MFELENIVPLDCCRIVKYDEYHDSLECSYEGHEEETMGYLLGGVKQAYNFDLLLETKYPDQEFQEYRPGGQYLGHSKRVLSIKNFKLIDIDILCLFIFTNIF
jgi:hypothetical protein